MFHRNLPVGFCGGFVNWRLYVLHYVAKALGLLVKVEGFPYGTSRNLCRDRDPVGINQLPWATGQLPAQVNNDVRQLTANKIGVT